MMMTEHKKNLRFLIFSLIMTLTLCISTAQLLYADYKRTTVKTVTTTTTTDNVPAAMYDGVHNPISFDINVKPTYDPTEDVTGKIVVHNTYASPLPATFRIKLYHNDKFQNELVSSMDQLLPGQTTFSLDEFGIPQINQNPNAQGQWTIVIYQNDPTQSKEATFRINSSS